MKCSKCDLEMKPVKLITASAFMGEVCEARFQTPGVFGTVTGRSGVDCFVCPTGGRIELCAKNPEAFWNC